MTLLSLAVVRIRDVVDAGLLEPWTACLCDEEHRVRARGLDAPTTARALVSRGLLRRALSRVAPLDPAAWRFEIGEHGRPWAPRPAPSFNVAHSGDTVACVTGAPAELGLDVEETTRALDLDAVARVSFSEGELRGLGSRSGAARRARFFALWTLKEAYLKARGAGLVLPLDGFTMSDVDTASPSITFAPGFGDVPEGWRFARPELGPHLAAAVAARDAEALRVQVEHVDVAGWLA
ncbi:MAG: 4'-phosphopantetheinyl transferase superfamily protein [Polyangiaceae bacterium]|nr:4'-phosphopantetheinyl transferase superfamily protein [Polyangiaceae bacterium]